MHRSTFHNRVMERQAQMIVELRQQCAELARAGEHYHAECERLRKGYDHWMTLQRLAAESEIVHDHLMSLLCVMRLKFDNVEDLFA